MSENFMHGVRIVEVESGFRTVKSVSSSVIGIVGTASEAIEKDFPLNTPILITGSEADAAKLGAKGTLPAAMKGIFDQTNAIVVLIRVEEGEDVEGTNLNIIGEIAADGIFTGAQALLATQAKLSVTPKIILCPGYSDAAIVTAMLTIANKLKAIYVADAPAGETEAVAFAKTNANDRMYVVYPSVVNTKNEIVAASPYVAGVIAKIDNEQGFWVSPSNKTLNGVVGLNKTVDFSMNDPACKANFLNEKNITTIINQDGFRVWGNRTTGETHEFLCVRRTADTISESILKAHLWAVDRNIVRNYLVDVCESVNAYLSSLRAQGAILAGKCTVNKELNPSSAIAQGKVCFDFEFTPTYPAESVTFRAFLNNKDIESIIFVAF